MSENKKQNAPRQGGQRFGPGGPHMMQGEKAMNFKGTMSKLLKYINRYIVAILIVIIIAALSTVLAIRGPKILGDATDIIIDGIVSSNVYDAVKSKIPSQVLNSLPEDITLAALIKQMGNNNPEINQISSKIPEKYKSTILDMKLKAPRPGIDFDAVRNIMMLLLGLYVFSALMSYIQGYVMSGIAQKISYRLRKDISEKLDCLPLEYYDTKTHGEILSRITNDVDTISTTLNQSLSQIVTAITTIIGILIMMLSISPILTLVAIITLPLSLGFIMLIVKHSQKYFKLQQEYLGHVNGHVEEMYSGHVVMKAFNGEEKSVEKFNNLNTVLYDTAWKSQFLSGLMMPVMQFIGNLGYVAICVIGGWLAVLGTVSVGNIQSFIQYVRQFTQPINQAANIANVLQSTAAAAERVFEFLEEAEQSPDEEVHLENSNSENFVEFSSVHFGYNSEKIIINDFSANIKMGQRVAIVGPTGAGKTTIVKLLMRFYDVNKGTILVDGTDIRKYSRNKLRSLFGMVLQDAWLFNGSVMENIRYGTQNATNEQVMNAAKTAYADHFIHALPGGYQMDLNEEASNISQGQKQLLTIARAVLANPKILILDEATSSVDTRTEVLIQKAMNKLMEGRTSFVIAHRLSTIRDADLILVMKDGDIVEQGSHNELIDANGFYANLYQTQFKE